MAKRPTRIVKTAAGDVRLTHYARLQSLLYDQPLACSPARIEQVVQTIGPRLMGLASKDESTLDVSADLWGSDMPLPEDVAVSAEGVAVVPIRGTFTPRAGAYDALSGMVSYEQTVELVNAVAADTRVKGLVLAIDSPGGAVVGVTEAAAAIAAIDKPVYVVADHQATSAAYWLGAQADKLFVPATGVVGSIGVCAVRLDATAADKEAGLAYTFVRSGERKGDGSPHKPLTKGEHADLQRIVDQSAALFFEAIADARGLTVEAVAAMEGAAFIGADAVARGLADQVGTVADAVAAMTKKVSAPTMRRPQHYGAAASTITEETIMAKDEKEAGAESATVVSLEDVKKAKAEGRTELASDLGQIQALCDIAAQGDVAKANALKAEFCTGAFAATDVSAALQKRSVAAQGGTEIQGHVSGQAPAPAAVGSKYIDPAPIYAARAKRRADIAAEAKKQLH